MEPPAGVGHGASRGHLRRPFAASGAGRDAFPERRIPFDSGHSEGLDTDSIVIVLAEATHLIEDDLHLVPEGAVVAVGEPLP